MKKTTIRRARFVQIVDEVNKALLIERLELRLNVCPTWLTLRGMCRRHGTFRKKEFVVQRSNALRLTRGGHSPSFPISPLPNGRRRVQPLLGRNSKRNARGALLAARTSALVQIAAARAIFVAAVAAFGAISVLEVV